jgi:hypothetical protein
MQLRLKTRASWLGMCLAAVMSAHCGPSNNGEDAGADAGLSMVTGTWTPVPAGASNDLLSVWGTAADDVYAVGFNMIRHWNGSSWTPSAMPPLALRAVGGSGPGNAWAVGLSVPAHGSSEVGRASILQLQSGSWEPVTPNSQGQLSAVWAASATAAWAVGEDTLLHWNGTAWGEVDLGMAPGALNAVWGSSPTDVWAVGQHVLHFNGTNWTVENTGPSGPYFYGVWGSGPRDVWVVGIGGAMRHWDGTRWTDLGAGANNLFAVWGHAANDVWAVGDNATLLHWNGAAWMPIEAPAEAAGKTLRSLWGTSNGSEIWATGQDGFAMRYRP